MFTTVKMFLLSNAYKLLGFSIKKIMPITYALAMYTHNTCLKHMCTYYTYSIFIHIYYIHSTFIHTYHIHPEYMCAHILYHLQHAYTHSYLYTISYTYSTCLHTSTVHVYAHTTMRKAHVNSFVVTDLEVKADRVWVVATMLQSTLPVSGTQHPFTTVNRVSESGHLHKTYNKTSLRTFVQDLFFVNHNVLEWEYTPNTEEWFKIHQPFRRRELRPTALCPSLGSASVTFCEGGREGWTTVPDLPCQKTNGQETGQQCLVHSAMLVGGKSLVPAWDFRILYEHLFEPQSLILKWH